MPDTERTFSAVFCASLAGILLAIFLIVYAVVKLRAMGSGRGPFGLLALGILLLLFSGSLIFPFTTVVTNFSSGGSDSSDDQSSRP